MRDTKGSRSFKERLQGIVSAISNCQNARVLELVHMPCAFCKLDPRRTYLFVFSKKKTLFIFVDDFDMKNESFSTNRRGGTRVPFSERHGSNCPE